MKRVVDTSAWIEWLIDSPTGRSLSGYIPEKSQLIVPTMIQLELTKWLCRELGEDQADQMLAFTEKCLVIDLTTPIALLAVALHREFRLATADAVVYATAQIQGAELLTCDAHFEGLPQVIFLKKC
ncbi:MAG: PIN domain-containing protein [Halothiobacillus sp.]